MVQFCKRKKKIIYHYNVFCTLHVVLLIYSSRRLELLKIWLHYHWALYLKNDIFFFFNFSINFYYLFFIYAAVSYLLSDGSPIGVGWVTITFSGAIKNVGTSGGLNWGGADPGGDSNSFKIHLLKLFMRWLKLKIFFFF